jgi:hypothetical protein
MAAGLSADRALLGERRARQRRRRSHGHETARQNGEAAQNGGEGAETVHKKMMLPTASPAKSGKITDTR